MSITVNYTDYFQRVIRDLSKKYPSLKKDLTPLIKQLKAGELPGDLLQHIGYSVYKVRVKNSDNQKGKSGGYRVIYYVKQQDDIILLTMYSKSEQEDISPQQIRIIIDKWINAKK